MSAEIDRTIPFKTRLLNLFRLIFPFNHHAAMPVNHLKRSGYNGFHRAAAMAPVTDKTGFTNGHFDLIAEKVS